MYALTTGVELELWVVDDAGRLCDGQAVVAAHDRIEPEFIDPLVEIRTEPHDDEHGLRRDLQGILRTAMRAADAEGKHLVPLGTPLAESDAPANCDRGRLFETIYGSGIGGAKNCAGTHIHFEKGAVLRQLNLLTALDPALALASSSPYYAGERGAASARALAYRTECGPEFRGFCDLWRYADSLAEWRERVDSMYDTFVRLAGERGVSEDTVDAHFDPEDTVLNPVRLRESQPTVEWRAPDATLPSQVVRLATGVGRLVAQTEQKPLAFDAPGVREDRIGVPEFPELRKLSRRAIDAGLRDAEVKGYLQKMGFDLSTYRPLSPRLAGPRTLDDRAVRALRLEQAARLRADVASLTDELPAPTPSPLDVARGVR